MEAIEKILVPIAFSPYTPDLIRFAAGLAGAFDSELLLLNIINERDVEIIQKVSSYGYNVDEGKYVSGTENDRLKELDVILDKIDFPDHRMRMKFKVGHPAEVILKEAVREEIDMIVMGIREKKDFLHSLTGSVADRVFRRSPFTIVSYRNEKNAGHLRKRLLEQKGE